MSKLVTLVDDFQDNVINTSLWSVTGGTETGGRARLIPGTTFAFWSAVSVYDLLDSQITIEVPVVTADGTTGTLQCGLAAGIDSDNVIALRKVGNQLVCSKIRGGTETELAFALYSSTNHRFWRIRESSGTVYWETSATGSGTFFIQYSVTTSTLFALDFLTPYFFTGYTGTETSPGTFQVEAVNAPIAITGSGASTSAGSATITIRTVQTVTASAASVSFGQAQLLTRHSLVGSGASTSSGSANLQIHAVGSFAITAAGASTSSGTALIMALAPGQLTATGQSFSAGSATLRVNYIMTAMGSSFATGTAHLDIIPATGISSQYYLFEPPVALDNPPTLPNPKPKYINSYARWKGGQRRGRTVLRTGSSYLTVDSPTIDQCNAADSVYLGGHVYTVTQAEANSLSAHGYSVTPILTDITAPVLNILAPHAMVNVDQIVRVLLTTSEPSALTGTLSTGDTVYPISIPSTAFSIDISELPDAVYRITITATDIAGNRTTDYVDINIIHDPPLGPCLYPSDSLFPSDSLYPILCRLAHPFPALTIYPSESLTP